MSKNPFWVLVKYTKSSMTEIIKLFIFIKTGLQNGEFWKTNKYIAPRVLQMGNNLVFAKIWLNIFKWISYTKLSNKYEQ